MRGWTLNEPQNAEKKVLNDMPPSRLELETLSLVGRRSIQLSYGGIKKGEDVALVIPTILAPQKGVSK